VPAFPSLFEYFTTVTAPPANQQAPSTSTLLTILPYAVVTRKGKQLTIVNEFHPTGQTLRNALHNGGESLRRPISIRTIYLGIVELSLCHYCGHSITFQLPGIPFLNKCLELCSLQTRQPVPVSNTVPQRQTICLKGHQTNCRKANKLREVSTIRTYFLTLN
jgi:hypothetical protein